MLVTGMAQLCRPDSQVVYKTLGKTVSNFLNVHPSEKKTGNMGNSELPSLGVFLIWLVFWFCCVFRTKNSYKHSLVAVTCPFSTDLSHCCDDPVPCFVIPAWRNLSGSAQLSKIMHPETSSVPC